VDYRRVGTWFGYLVFVGQSLDIISPRGHVLYGDRHKKFFLATDVAQTMDIFLSHLKMSLLILAWGLLPKGSNGLGGYIKEPTIYKTHKGSFCLIQNPKSTSPAWTTGHESGWMTLAILKIYLRF